MEGQLSIRARGFAARKPGEPANRPQTPMVAASSISAILRGPPEPCSRRFTRMVRFGTQIGAIGHPGSGCSLVAAESLHFCLPSIWNLWTVTSSGLQIMPQLGSSPESCRRTCSRLQPRAPASATSCARRRVPAAIAPAPTGSGAPVRVPTACPGPRSPANGWPAAASPITVNLLIWSGTRSGPLTAKPSTAALSQCGKFTFATKSVAKTLPRALAMSTPSVSRMGQSWVRIAARASARGMASTFTSPEQRGPWMAPRIGLTLT